MADFPEHPPADPSLVARMVRAARLDADLYAEVEGDRKANRQAAAVVFLAALAGGLGSSQAPAAVLANALIEVVVWLIFAWIVYAVGARLLPEPQTDTQLGAVARALGFSHAPLLLQVLGVVTPLRGLVLLTAGVWSLVAMVTAVRHALSYSSAWRAAGVCMLPLLGRLLVVVSAVALLSGDGAAPEGGELPVQLPW